MQMFFVQGSQSLEAYSRVGLTILDLKKKSLCLLFSWSGLFMS